MQEEITKETIEGAKSLVGVFDKGQKLTPLELAVAKHQGLVDENDKIKAEHLRKPEQMMPSNLPAPVPIENLISDDAAARLEQGIADIRGEDAIDAVVDDDMQLGDDGLDAPDLTGANDIAPDENASKFASVDDLAVRLHNVISTAEEPIRCNHCGWDQREMFENPPWTEDDKLAFLGHLMSSGGRFYKTFELFGGQMKITLRSRTQNEIDAIMNQARNEMKDEELVGVGDTAAQVQRYQVAASVSEIEDTTTPLNTKKYKSITETESTDELSAVRIVDNALFGDCPAAKFGAIMAVWLEFERLYGWFSSRAYDQDFWQAVVGDPS